MKILLVHNSYQQPGGEDIVFEQERQMLERAGHQVSVYVRHNDEIKGYGLWRKAGLALQTVWASDGYGDVRALLKRAKADVAHFHNTFPLVSPAAYYACREAGVPVVQTLHNYRLSCPAANFFRDGKVCEECVEHSLWRGVRHGCYRNSRAVTATVALMLTVHRSLGTWTNLVDCYIALSAFSRRKLIDGGLPAENIFVKSNFVSPDPGARVGDGEYAVFVGRLFPEKRVDTVLRAWELLRNRIPLFIVGSGPQRTGLENDAAKHCLSSVRFLGQLDRKQTLAAIKGARFLISSSEWFENFPVTIAEAFACRTPIICSRLGAMEEIVADGRTGLHFTPGNAQDLAQKVEWAWDHPEQMTEMGRQARKEYEDKYTAEKNYPVLMEIYQHAVAGACQSTRSLQAAPHCQHVTP
jgi:glycosyltransferase involved in cell wall biosynthesis